MAGGHEGVGPKRETVVVTPAFIIIVDPRIDIGDDGSATFDQVGELWRLRGPGQLIFKLVGTTGPGPMKKGRMDAATLLEVGVGGR